MASLPLPSKSAIRDQIVAALQAEHDLQVRAAQTAREEAISEESRAENKYDTHSQEAAYLAEGQAKLAAEIGESIELYKTLPLPAPTSADAPAALGSLIAVENGSRQNWYFLGPRSGGLELQVEGFDVLLLTPQSPLGRELLGKRAGDSVRLPGRAAATPAKIAAVL